MGRPIIIFVTMCTDKRKPILANVDAMRLLTGAWRQAGEWLVGRFVIMPDHVHLFCSPATQNPYPLMKWVVYWKSLASKSWPRRRDFPIWQKDFWDRQLRAEENYGDKWEYIRCNPVRHGLVALPEAWPYQGELNVLRWE
jgi:REP element-mobilizing transposase RayT